MQTLKINTIAIPKKDMVLIEKKDLEKLTKENRELNLAFMAISDGNSALYAGKTRSFKNFIEDKFPQYAKNI